jgi:hypothetical protein
MISHTPDLILVMHLLREKGFTCIFVNLLAKLNYYDTNKGLPNMLIFQFFNDIIYVIKFWEFLDFS